MPVTWSANLRAWTHRHPELWVTIVLYLASCFFVYGFGQVAHWIEGIQQGRLVYDCKWDCGWYGSIADHGYQYVPEAHSGGDAANWAFFPLFPMSAAVVEHLLRLDPLSATVLASRLELFGAIFAFLLWLRPYFDNNNERYFAGALVALNPYVIYAHAGYSEPLYFMLACLGFWALDRHKWILAGLFGAGLSANRLVGLLFSLVYLIVALRDVGWRGIIKDRSLRILTGLLLCPLGLVLFSLYLYHHVGDALAFAHIQVAWGRATTNPVIVLLRSYHQHGWIRFFAELAVIGLLVSLWLMRKRPELGIFLALSIFLPCASGTLQGFPRYLWWQPPFLYVIFVWLRRSVPAWMIYLAIGGGLAAVMVLQWFTPNIYVT
jgi:Mannosyltransferase (PIG-V)